MISAVTRISPSGRDSAECDVSYYHVPRSTGENSCRFNKFPCFEHASGSLPERNCHDRELKLG